MAKRDKVIKKYKYTRTDGIYEVTVYASGIRSTHVTRTDEQKEALMESAYRRARRNYTSKNHQQARRLYDKAIKSINGSISSALRDRELGAVTGDVNSVIHLIHDTIAETGYDAKRDDQFPSSSKLTDEQFERFFQIASSVKINPNVPLASNAFPGLRRSYRKDFNKLMKEFSLGAKTAEGRKMNLSKETLNDVVRLALAAPSIWSQLRKEDQGYEEVDMIFSTLRDNHPNLNPHDILMDGYKKWVESGRKVRLLEYLKYYIDML